MMTKAWRLLRIADHEALFCLLCDTYSFHPKDIADVHCGQCHTSLIDVPLDHQRADDDRVPSHDPLGGITGRTGLRIRKPGELKHGER